VISDCPPDTVYLHCHRPGDVQRVVDATVVVGKSETLHPSCAETWFGNLASITIEPRAIDDAARAVRPFPTGGRR
jgi:hypothetical protein